MNFSDVEKTGKPQTLPPPTLEGQGLGLTFKYVLELVLLEAGTHGLFDGTDVLVELDHQRVVVHTFHVGDDGIVPLLRQRDEIVEAVNPEKEIREGITQEVFLMKTILQEAVAL